MMYDGKLVWHKDWDVITRKATGEWYTNAADNEDRFYRARRADSAWEVSVDYRFGHEPQFLGRYPKLAEAKRVVDRHHHARILESDNENLKNYVRRYPLEDEP